MSQRIRLFEGSDKDSRLVTSSENASSRALTSGTSSEKAAGTSRNGKAPVAVRKSSRPLLKFTRGVPIPEAFLKVAPLKRAKVSVDPLKESHPRDAVLRDPTPRVHLPSMTAVIELVRVESDKGSSSGSVHIRDLIEPVRRGHAFRDSREVPNTYAYGSTRQAIGESEQCAVFSLEVSVDFICFNERNFVRSIESVPGKMSIDDHLQ
ncbi:hypothetical protein ACOSP7_018153 [Xanthoceras sorbifolium]